MYPDCRAVVSAEGGFPRTRGDVPPGLLREWRRDRLPPHARGCTPRHHHRRPLLLASPARAGMYPPPSSSSPMPPSFPRTRGDVPCRGAAAPLARRLPPHARGCTVLALQPDRPAAASPARAGMYLETLPAAPRRGGFPRTRGDVPLADFDQAFVDGLPPHARGCTRAASVIRDALPASPARAGMYREDQSRPDPRCRFPRTRGDVPHRLVDHVRVHVLPPHARGCTPNDSPADGRPLASPARAGMYRTSGCRRPGRPRFPRTRGDVPPTHRETDMDVALPPHARGCTQDRAAHPHLQRASPARAGMYPCAP